MPRRPRQRHWAESACYHVFSRGHNRETIFHDDRDRQAFLDLLARYQERFSVRLYHYCLMGNHFHLLLQLAEPARLSRLMAGMLVAYVHHCHRRHGFVGHLFQGRFKSKAVERDSYLLSCGRYIERNPVEAGLAQEPWQYAWSSSRRYALGSPDRLVSENPCYGELSPSEERRRQLWREFLLGEDPKEAEVRRIEGVVGAEGFRSRLADWQGRPVRNRKGRPAAGRGQMQS